MPAGRGGAVTARVKKCLDDGVAAKVITRTQADEALDFVETWMAGRPGSTEGQAAAAAAFSFIADLKGFPAAVPVIQPGQAIGVIVMHPVPQRLPIHPGCPCRCRVRRTRASIRGAAEATPACRAARKSPAASNSVHVIATATTMIPSSNRNRDQ